MYAIIQTGGKQIKVAKGDSVLVEKLDVKEGETTIVCFLFFVYNITDYTQFLESEKWHEFYTFARAYRVQSVGRF